MKSSKPVWKRDKHAGRAMSLSKAQSFAVAFFLATFVLLSAACGKALSTDLTYAADQGPAVNGRLTPRLGIVEDGKPRALENGGRVALTDGVVAEVFLAPYPPGWRTDLNLFLLKEGTYEPVKDVDVDMEYEMTYMDHGIDTQRGLKVKDGRYVLPLNFLMYADWTVDIRLTFPEGKEHLMLLVKFFP